MPSYFYHLKFELYPTPNLIPSENCSAAQPATGADDRRGGATKEFWLPVAGTDIFGELPAHPFPDTAKQRKKLLQTARPQPSPIQPFELSHRPALGPGPNPYPSLAENPEAPGNNVIDCGLSRAQAQQQEDSGKNIEILTERQWKARTESFPPPHASAAIRPDTAVRDWRFGRVRIESFDEYDTMSSDDNNVTGKEADAGGSSNPHAATGIGPTFSSGGVPTKAKYLPSDTKNTEVGWGVVHFYRDAEESSELRRPATVAEQPQTGQKKDDWTTLCIPAVPSYMMPGDLLGFIGPQWREGISHYRIVMTAQMSRYMVLIKFRSSQRAKEWQKEFDGKPFSDVGQVCQVVFVKSITFETPSQPNNSEFPDLSRDPFTPSSSSAPVSNTLRPFPPPTPNLIELPTCAVCLERMDDTTGLMTIACQHVFHCTCLENWKGSGCPVCRHTSETFDPSNPYNQPFGGSAPSNLCSVCDSTDDIWICLICGRVGCGRYKGGHAKDHWKETAHSFALELETQHVWDYAGDTWVHRLIRDKGDGKVVELPGSTGMQHRQNQQGDHQGASHATADDDVVPRAKVENMGLEYSHLITSQLESQRVYFEELVSKISDKAAKASSTAESASRQVEALRAENDEMRRELDRLKKEVVPQLERDGERDRARADKAQDLARKLGRSVQEEKEMAKGLMERVEHEKGELDALRTRDKEYQEKIAELEEMNRDLSMFISGQEKLKEMETEGQVEAGELAESSAAVPEKKGRRRGKK